MIEAKNERPNLDSEGQSSTVCAEKIRIRDEYSPLDASARP